ncbi:MAG: rhodanese-like domain-containing protein [Alphaproteobacteria bacterium]|nr:rhodanese-like domain-containing protein [Alphaproteobacteria bacterium]
MTSMATWTEKRLIEIDAATLCRWLASDMAVLVDVREEWEFAQDRIPGAINLPLSKFDIRKLPVEDGRRLVLTCAVGRRSAQAAGILLATGRDTATHLQGGMLAWDDAGFESESGAPVAADTARSRDAILSCASA